jgi:hypothetical protein
MGAREDEAPAEPRLSRTRRLQSDNCKLQIANLKQDGLLFHFAIRNLHFAIAFHSKMHPSSSANANSTARQAKMEP